MSENKIRYSDKDLAEFRSIIEEKIRQAKEDLELIVSSFKNDSNNGTEDTSPTFASFFSGLSTLLMISSNPST